MSSGAALDLRDRVRDVPDFPKPGIVFKDIMPLRRRRDLLPRDDRPARRVARPRQPDIILGAEARGFIFGGALADRLGCGFVAARKPGKLPWETVEATYDLEYGTDALQVHADAISTGTRVIVHDDVLATGGTARGEDGARRAARRRGRRRCSSSSSSTFLNGRDELAGYDVYSLIQY